MLPIPIPSIFIISLLTFIKSLPKNEEIPLNFNISSVVNTWSVKDVVTAVETTGDWIILSNAKRTFAFWLVETNLCEVPIPTLVIFKTSGTILRAFVELDASFTLFSSTFTIKTLVVIPAGTLSVDPTPVIDVVAIPIAWVEPAPAW